MISIACLDYCLLRGGTPREAVNASILTARQAESLGYSRYWLSEHHTRDVAHCTPEILIPMLARATTTLRIGAAGTLLRYHRPYRIARSFKLLEALFPGRIDLGIARGVVDKNTAKLLGGEGDSADIEIHVRELCDMLAEDYRSPAFPRESVWMLGGLNGMRSAVQHSTGFSLCLFLGEMPNTSARDILAEYRATWSPGSSVTPKSSIALAGICAESFDRAAVLFKESTAAGLVHITPTIIGSPGHCKSVLDRLANECGAEEFVFLDLCARVEDRLQSLSLLAAEIGLKQRTPEPHSKEWVDSVFDGAPSAATLSSSSKPT